MIGRLLFISALSFLGALSGGEQKPFPDLLIGNDQSYPLDCMNNDTLFFNNVSLGSNSHLVLFNSNHTVIKCSDFISFSGPETVSSVTSDDIPATLLFYDNALISSVTFYNVGIEGNFASCCSIDNSEVNFSSSAASKNERAVKATGIKLTGGSFRISNSTVNNSDEGIVVRASYGDITGNTVKFDVNAASKGLFIKKGIVVSDNSNVQISENYIKNDDWESVLDVIGIEVGDSGADILYNRMLFSSWDMGPRTGVRIVNPADTVRVINNTIYNPLLAFSVTQGAMPVDVEFINNIYWSDNTSSYKTIDYVTGVTFSNNCFMDSLNITGTGNIFTDPEINNTWAEDFTLASTSPCINAGMIVDSLHTFASSKTIYYYGPAPDIGSKEFWQDSQPVSVTTSVSGTDFTFSWNTVEGFTNYAIYASDDPFGTFTKLEVVSGLSYTASIDYAKKFYYVTATTDPVGKYSDDPAAVTEVKTEPVKNKRPNIRINRPAVR